MFRSLLLVSLIAVGPCAMADDAPRTVSVTGMGYAAVEPDRAMVRMSIVARRPSLAAAQAEAAKVTGKVLAMCGRLKIRRERVDSTGASVRPDYRWNRSTEEQELKGYIAERQIVVDVRDLDQLGELVEGAVVAGVNQVSPPQLDSGKRRDAYREALAHAAQDARANAEQLAKSLGAKLGPVVEINAGTNTPPPPTPRNMRVGSLAADSGAAESYNAADLSFDATISATFELVVD